MATKVIPETAPEDVPAGVAAPPATAEAAVAANAEEYGTWVAGEQIFIGTALGYNPGDPVGNEVAQRLKFAEGDAPKVVKKGSKRHQEIRAAQGLPPLES